MRASIWCYATPCFTCCLPTGGVFETERESLDLVLRYAVRRVNQRRDLLPITALNCDVMTAPMHDSFLMSRQGQ